MRIFLTCFLLWALFTVWARWYYVCKIKHRCGTEQIVSTDDGRGQNLNFYDGSKALFQSNYDQFLFNGDKIDLNSNNEAFLEKLAGWMKKNPERSITITGKYLESEKGISSKMYENLGLARAGVAREKLMRLGITEDRIGIDSDMIGGDKLAAPLAFAADAAATPDEYADGNERLTKAKFTFTNMTYSDANFEYNSDVFSPGTAFRSYADSVKTFLVENPKKSLHIIGHTDNKGSTNYNLNLGKRRAENTKKYFRSLGVKSTIKTSSRGKAEPIATNSTDAGRQKNRRVNVQIVD